LFFNEKYLVIIFNNKHFNVSLRPRSLMLFFFIKSTTMKTAMLSKNFPISTKKKQSKFIKKNVIFFGSILLLVSPILFSFFTRSVFADTVSNDNYSIDVNTIDTNPQPTPKKEVLGTTYVKIKEFTTGSNYTVTAPTSFISLGLSQNSIDYGILSSTNPVIRTSNILLNNNLLGGEILSYENHPLKSATNDVIQNSSCDNGTCTPEIAAIWTNTLTYGFGYRCDSSQKNICDAQFSSLNYFKPYADSSAQHTPVPILLTDKGQSQASVTYKVNISGTQKTGGYYNSITYLAIPKF
jgi:hypothetical protein